MKIVRLFFLLATSTHGTEPAEKRPPPQPPRPIEASPTPTRVAVAADGTAGELVTGPESSDEILATLGIG